MTRTLRDWLAEPVDAAGVGFFRIAFGAVMVFSVVRFAAYGWIDTLLTDPAFHFTYDGFEWVRPWPAPWMVVHFAAMGLCALLVMVGVYTRVAAGLFAMLFTYAELIEKAAYLNHYYLISLIAVLLAVVPSDRAFAFRPASTPGAVPRIAYVVLRAQVGLVYFFAGFAKLGADWLVDAQPLRTWLQAYAHWPVVGPLLDSDFAAFAFSGFGAAFDLTIVAWLLWARTRRVAFAMAAAFHIVVWLLFPIGVFSWVMIAAATIFFDPAWARRFARPLGGRPAEVQRPLSRVVLASAAAWVLVQVLVPLRFLAYPGPVNLTEEGFRFAWRVMLIEKAGQVEYRVEVDEPPASLIVHPRSALSPMQYRALSTQPDLIHEYAVHLRQQFEAGGARGVRVYADAFVAFNGRPSTRVIDPTVDLGTELRSSSAKPWILRHLD